MAVSFQDYINTVKSSSAQRILKIDILDSQENTIGTITPNVISGDLQLSSDSGSRRSANIVLDNSSGAYIPQPGGQFWLNTKYRIWSGYKVNGQDYLFSRGIFVSGEPSVDSVFAEQSVSLQLYDKYLNLNGELGGELDSTYVIPLNSSVEAAVKQILIDAGEVKKPIVVPNSWVTPYTLIAQPGDNYGTLLQKLADMVSCQFFFDANGYPRFQPSTLQPTTNIFNAGSVWSYGTDEITYLGSRHRFEYSKVKNYIKVIGSNISGTTYSAISQDTNPNSPTRIALIGKKTHVIQDDMLFNSSLCQTRSDWELQKAIQLVETVNMNAVPVDCIEGDNVILVTDSGNGLNATRFLVKSVNFPLMNDADMTLNVWMVRTLS